MMVPSASQQSQATWQRFGTVPLQKQRFCCKCDSRLAHRKPVLTNPSRRIAPLAVANLGVEEPTVVALSSLHNKAAELAESLTDATDDSEMSARRLQRKAQRAREQMTYKVSAIAASVGVTTLAIAAVYYRFVWHLRDGREFPVLEAILTLLLVAGGVIGMEMWARFAHKALWHEFEPGWALHKSHHEPRIGPFEANDVFAIANALPAMGLCLYGFLTPTLGGGICFGAGLGITLFGIMYMFVHDGLVHKRFPVGPIADVPYLKRVAVAHRLHHSEKYNGVPWGMFLGPQELEAVGAREELDRMCAELDMSSKQRQ